MTGSVEPADPDVDLHDRAQRAETSAHPRIIALIAVGGAAGAEARYALDLVWRARPGGLDWVTLLINLSGCLALALLISRITLRPGSPWWLRPLAGTGFLAGFTTFSTFAVAVHAQLDTGRWVPALAYLAATALGAGCCRRTRPSGTRSSR